MGRNYFDVLFVDNLQVIHLCREHNNSIVLMVSKTKMQKKRYPQSKDTKTKTLSASYQVSAQVVMHKVLPGDLDPRLTEVKVYKS